MNLYVKYLVLSVAMWVGLSSVAAASSLATVTVTKTQSPKLLPIPGNVEAINQATMTAKTAGTIVELNFDVNDYVKKDQVLLSFKGKRNQAGLSQAQAGVSEAEARVVEARNEYNRLKSLFDQKMVTASQMDQAQGSLQAARARLNAAKAGLTSASEGVDDTVLRAPYSGYVTQRFVQLGENASVGQRLFTGISLDELRVITNIPQKYADVVRVTRSALVEISSSLAQQVRRIPVKDVVVFPVADPASRTVGVRIKLPEGIQGIYPGMLVKVFFVIGQQEKLIIPESTVVRRSELTAVYVMNPGQPAPMLRMVRLGQVDEAQQVEVVSGLLEGDLVVKQPALATQVALSHYQSMRKKDAIHE
ncbi:efflux transporter, RND family, MFP subunit [Magnetococcus marinus MC-1]|uniref:Efflux transporter, RND family, MFP subunit n=1 Tax=Magnetococcus marinus (strain ATCC BAA-1437 / JCM 17883 / MC-1) TaxID=156889 RepID=A0L6A5_MAGMM|nr:efflux RND transporter periplasmic adaptor subunit [Magnetococcus marinus]ABK43498.1 efflux transporter, RND family, MFP subunit [Magnetococcus marinus MC-1]